MASFITQNRPLWLAVSVAVLMAVLTQTLVSLDQSRVLQKARAKITQQASAVAAQIESQVTADVFLANGLAALVAVDQELSSVQIQSALRAVYESGRHLKNIGLAPGNRITHVYPLAGNEKALGLYYPNEPGQWASVKQAFEQRSTVLAGPLQLRQGGTGLIIRTPVFLEGGRYWGVLSLVIDADALLAKATQTADQLDLEIALRGMDSSGLPGTVFHGSPELFQTSSVALQISVPGGEWEMLAQPKGGWQAAVSHYFWWRVAGWVFILLLGGVFYRYGVGRMRVNTIARRLRAFLDTTPDGVIVINERGLVEEFNPAAEKMFGYARSEILGQSVNRLMQSDVANEHDRWVGRAEETAARAMAKGREIQGLRKDGASFPIEVTVGDAQVDGRLVHVGVLRDITERKAIEHRLNELATQDGLTGIANRRAIMAALEEAWQHCRRYQQPLAILMIDADHFKGINDTHGHLVGDQVLICLAKVIRECIRETDKAGRLGGEEFLAILPGTSREQADVLAQRLLKQIAEQRVPAGADQQASFTVSIGIASAGPEVTSVENLIRLSDQALYRAKSAGRNRSC